MRTADPAASASTSTSRPVLRAIVAFLPRRTVSACSAIGLAHVLLGGERAALIDADFGHHSARRPAGTGRSEAGEPPPVPVLEVVDVVRATPSEPDGRSALYAGASKSTSR